MTHQRYVLLALIATAILIGWTVQAGTVSGMAQFAYPDNRLMGLLNTSTTLALVVSAGTFFALIRNKRVLTFGDEVVGELFKVTWPSREETVRASTTVVLTTLFTAGMLALYDLIWKNLADLILFTDS